MLYNHLMLLLLHLATISAWTVNHKYWRIVNGKSVAITIAPWQVSLQTDGSHSCGGSIISSKLIVTAAHCVQPFEASDLTVRAGSTFWKSGGQLIKVASIKTHPDFETKTFTNDIAIVQLKRSLKLGRKAKAIKLALKEPKKGAKVSVTGWGDTGKGTDALPKNLQKVYLSVLGRQECQSDYNTYRKKITRGMICAAARDKDACQGDSGGPLVSNGKLVGVVSFGIGCAIEGIPGVYTNIAYYSKWIKKQLRKC